MRLIPDEELLTEDEIETLREVFALMAEEHPLPLPAHHGLWRLEAEREAAAVNVEPLLRQTPIEKWPELTTHPALRTAGALRLLGNLATDALPGNPKYALAVAQLAIAVVEAMPEDAYPGTLDQLRLKAWTNLGSAFRALGRYDDAVRALQTAGSMGGERVLLEYDVALADLILARVLQETNRFEEARPLLQKCKEIFREFGDKDLAVQCGLLEDAPPGSSPSSPSGQNRPEFTLRIVR